MKLLFWVFLSALLFSCKSDELPFEEECPYNFAINAHLFKVPIEVIPHQQIYSVGDTIIFRSVYPDSIVDVGAQEKFLIRDFPFQPLSYLYRFKNFDFDYDAGYTVNDHIIENKYNPYYQASTERIDWFRAKTIYENGKYHFEHQLVLKEKGRYVMLTTDVFAAIAASSSPEYDEVRESIEFEGKCDRIPMTVVSILENDDHMEEFIDELVFLDQNVYFDGLISRDQGANGPLKSGGLQVEFAGLFCFEVVE